MGPIVTQTVYTNALNGVFFSLIKQTLFTEEFHSVQLLSGLIRMSLYDIIDSKSVTLILVSSRSQGSTITVL